MRIHAVIGLVLFVAAALFGVSAPADTVNVYLLGGQSNMQGIGFIRDLTETQKKIPSGTYFLNAKTFEPLVLGKTRTSSRPAEFVPEIGFCR